MHITVKLFKKSLNIDMLFDILDSVEMIILPSIQLELSKTPTETQTQPLILDVNTEKEKV